MSARKNPIRVILAHVIAYTDRAGEAAERTFRTALNGDLKVHDGGSVYLGTLDVIVGVATAFGETITLYRKLVCRIRVDGAFVMEPQIRKDDWIDDKTGEGRTGALAFDLLGDESRIAFAASVAAGLPVLAKRVKSAREYLKKHAVAA